jgi:hypothetical protein
LIRKEKVVRGATASEHIVQFYDSRESLANSVATFLAEGCRQGEQLLVVAKPTSCVAIASRLKARGFSLADGKGATVTILDAHTALGQFMCRGLPDSVLFHKTVGELIRKLAAVQPKIGLRIYGEMVEILAEEGNFHAAHRLEELWNELAVRYSFVLLCGYSAAHFAGRDSREALASICSAHSLVHKTGTDPLADWLLDRVYTDADSLRPS